MDPDVTLVVDNSNGGSGTEGERVELKVWSQVMCNASPYFQALLSPGRFEEGDRLQSDGKIEVALPETNPAAMSVLCDIFHLRTEKVMATHVSSDLLFEIAVLADRFECARQLKLWSDMWMAQSHINLELQAIEQRVQRTLIRNLSKWIVICQSFEYSSRLSVLKSALLKRHTVRDLEQEGNMYLDYLRPSLIEDIRTERAKVIREFYSIATRFAEKAEQDGLCTHESRNRAEFEGGLAGRDNIDERFHCSSITLGNFLLAARTELGSDWRVLSSWIESIKTTHNRMQRVVKRLTGTSQIVEVAGTPRTNKKNVPMHERCSMQRQLSDQIERVLGNIAL